MKKEILYRILGVFFLLLNFVFGKSQTLTGKITDANALPLANVSVHLLNTTVTTQSDRTGSFIIKDAAAGKYIIQLSSVGYATIALEIEVKKDADNAFSFQLPNALLQLEAVTVTAEKKEANC